MQLRFVRDFAWILVAHLLHEVNGISGGSRTEGENSVDSGQTQTPAVPIVFPEDASPTATATTTPSCNGICMNAATCQSLGGVPKYPCEQFQPLKRASGGTDPTFCCHFDTSCHSQSSSMTTYYQSPNYPAPVIGNLLCHHAIIVQPGVCGVRLEFLEFNITSPLDRGLCHVDQFMVLNSLEGAAFPRCGHLTSYATVVPVDARYGVPLILLNIIQSSKETFKWNIRVSQIRCQDTKRIRDMPGCGKNFDAEGLILSKPPVVQNGGLWPVDNSISNALAEGSDKVTKHGGSDRDSEGDGGDDDVDSGPKEFVARESPDNAFYIEYLKQSYQALVADGPAPDPNTTYCKNTLNATLTTATGSGAGGAGVVASPSPIIKQRIIRGNDAQLYEFPWQVSIQDYKGHVCGGTIISEYFIVSASHCFMSVSPVSISKLKIVIGDLNLNSTTDTEHVVHQIHSIMFHAHFDPYYLTNDIALVRLRTPVSFRKGIQPICLPEIGNSYVGRMATISGWGATHYPQGKLATKLQRVETEIMDTTECKRVLKTQNIYGTMMCALAPKCSGTCFGDSGGPLIVTDKQSGSSHLIGIVSFGIGGCALLPYWPDVYTRVSEYVDWLSYATLM